LIAVSAVVLTAAIGYGAYWALVLRHHESTDNAYVQAPMVQITPQSRGHVLAVLVDDTDVVQVGQPLVRLDPAMRELALERAESQLAQTVREVRTLYANNGSARRHHQAASSRGRAHAAEVARANDDVARRKPLTATGAGGRRRDAPRRSRADCSAERLAGARPALAAAREQAHAEPGADRRHEASRTIRTCSARGRGARGLPRAAAHELPAPVIGQVAKAHGAGGASASSPAAPLMVDHSARPGVGQRPTSRKCSCARCASASR
jgi:membrane fusion protein (multidrug efflux system)